jgi:D-glycero-alpha-D-manno-heptose-7-phosphate kinase
MRFQLSDILEEALECQALPGVVGYNRIDGPGSSLDLREFQQALWSMPSMPENMQADTAMEWTRTLPRTVGITIDTGTKIEAYPFESDKIGVRSIEYGTEAIAKPGEVLPIKENWLLKIVEIFGLTAATATTGVCLLANELAGRPFSQNQLLPMASLIEQDYGVSITGTQEQSNVIFGGVTDYVWFPWGIPGRPKTGYGTSLRSELVQPEDYCEIEQRMVIFHSGLKRASTDVNSAWMDALSTSDGYQLHKTKLEIAYRFREGLRLRKWDEVLETISKYREVRTRLCPEYMEGAREIQGFADDEGCAAFPLGAGGGGGVLVFGTDPNSLCKLREDLQDTYREIPYEIKSKGYELTNLPIKRR